MMARASGSMYVVTKVARFFIGSPSSRTSDSSTASAVRGSRLCSGMCRTIARFVKYRSAT
jgi:hypothetical protein